MYSGKYGYTNLSGMKQKYLDESKVLQYFGKY